MSYLYLCNRYFNKSFFSVSSISLKIVSVILNEDEFFFFFSNLQNRCFSLGKRMFSRICVFPVLCFFCQTNCKNHAANRSREKLSKKSLWDPPGSHFGPQNRLKSCARRPKNQKNTKKSSFGREPFFDHFFDRIFYHFLGQNRVKS